MVVSDGSDGGGFDLTVMSNSFGQESLGSLLKDVFCCFGLDR